LVQGSLDATHEIEIGERFVSLWHGFHPRPPAAASLGGAMKNLVSQALDHEFPAAPEFEAEPRGASLKKVFEVVSEAARTADGRVPVEKGPLRSLVRSIANPLRLGEMGLDATHFVLGHYWRSHITKKMAETGAVSDVRQLRKWIDEPKAMGLPKEVQNMVILTFAQQTNRTFLLHSGPYECTLTDLPDACELREQRLPDENRWDQALRRAGAIFGISISPLRSASNVDLLASKVKEKVAAARQQCQVYTQKLKERIESLGIPATESDRLKTAIATLMLVERLNQESQDSVVDALDAAEIATSEAAMGECFTKAGNLQGVLESIPWEVFDAVGKLLNEKKPVAEAIRTSVVEALRCDEHVTGLAGTLKEAQSKALRLVTEVSAERPQPPPPEVIPPSMPPEPTVQPGRRIVDCGTTEYLSVEDAKRKLEEISKLTTSGRMLSLMLTWRIEEEKGS
jgi:hypothetical protein